MNVLSLRKKGVTEKLSLTKYRADQAFIESITYELASKLLSIDFTFVCRQPSRGWLMRGIRPGHRWVITIAGKYPFGVGAMVLFVSTMAVGSSTALWFLAGSGLAVLTAWAVVWQTGCRQARVALATRSSMLRNPVHLSEGNQHLAAMAVSLPAVQDSILKDSQDQPQVRQLETGLRRATLSRSASRRLLARRPIPGPRRHHLRKWGHR